LDSNCGSSGFLVEETAPNAPETLTAGASAHGEGAASGIVHDRVAKKNDNFWATSNGDPLVNACPCPAIFESVPCLSALRPQS